MISNARYATNYVGLLFAIIVLIDLIPDGSIPTWAQIVIGVVLGTAARSFLLTRLNAQSQQQTDARR